MAWLQHVPSATKHCPSKQHAPQINGGLAAGLHVWECPDCKLKTVVSIDNPQAATETVALPTPPPLLPMTPTQPIKPTMLPTPPKKPYDPTFDVNRDLVDED